MTPLRMKALCGRVSSAVPDKYTDEDTDLLNKNPEVVVPMIEEALDKALAKIKDTNKLLQHICDFTLPVQPRFVSADNFKVNTSETAKVKFSGFGGCFKEEFIDDVVVDPVGEIKVAVDKLLKPEVDGPVMNELGNEYEIGSSHIYAFLAQNGDGESGDWFIFYAKGKKGLRAVRTIWCGGGWHVYASSVVDPYGWSAGDQVVSRKSSVAQA